MPNRSSTRMQLCISARCESPLPATKTSATTCFLSMSSRSAAVPRISARRRSWTASSLNRRWPSTRRCPLLIANLQAGVAAERADAHDEHLPDRDLAAMQPARRRAEPEDARQRNEDETIELAAHRVRPDEEPQRPHRDEHRGEQGPRQDDVSGECPPVPAVVVPEHPSAEHPNEDGTRPHAEEHEPVPGLTLGLRRGRARREQDDAVADEIQVLCGLLGHRRDKESERANERKTWLVAGSRPITLATTQCGRVQIGQGDSGPFIVPAFRACLARGLRGFLAQAALREERRPPAARSRRPCFLLDGFRGGARW